jgi:hypothetical protein
VEETVKIVTTIIPLSIITFFMLLFCINDSNAQSYSPVSATINQSMRSMALGGATVAMEGYAGAALINPATIGIEQTVQFQSYLFNQKGAPFNRPYFYKYSFFTPSVDARYGKSAVSISMPYYNLNAMSIDSSYYKTVKGHFYDYMLQLSGAWEIKKNVRVGIGLKRFGTRQPVSKYIVGGNPNDIETGKAYGIDLGVLYHENYDLGSARTRLSIGGSLLNFGTNFKYNNGAKDPLPLNLKAGFGLKTESSYQWYNHPYWGIGIYGALSHIMARKDNNGQPYNAFQMLFKGWSSYNNYDGLNTYKVSTWDQIERHLGLEASILDILRVRWGIDYQSPKTISNGITHSWGFGFDLYYLIFDYTSIKYDASKTAFKTPKHVWQATIRIPLASSPRNFWPYLLDELKIKR